MRQAAFGGAVLPVCDPALGGGRARNWRYVAPATAATTEDDTMTRAQFTAQKTPKSGPSRRSILAGGAAAGLGAAVPMSWAKPAMAAPKRGGVFRVGVHDGSST